VVPGLYVVGTPNDKSPILVTANYKLSFDLLRKELSSQNLWILVLDTLGINVWCAAGKGTFGTDEVINRIEQSGLKSHTKSRQLIFPQLGASGVAGWMVTRKTGFRVTFGPVRSSDIKAFLEAGNQGTEKMRRVTFTLKERIPLIPVEIVHNSPFILLAYALVFLMKVFAGQNLDSAAFGSLLGSVPYVGAILLGVIVFPIILPILPFRYFSVKGALLGTAWYSALLFRTFWHQGNGILISMGSGLLIISITSWIALNFTGSTTFTSYSGVKKEMDLGLLPIVMCVGVGLVLLLISAIFFKIA